MHNFEMFNNKSEIYDTYRPTYSKRSIRFLFDSNIIGKNDVIVDIGAGTGILSRAFLEYGNKVISVEPNGEMRNKCTENLKQYKSSVVIDATAENTTLLAHSINVVVVGQAFHWFEPNAFKNECMRILNDKKLVILMWNQKKQNCEMEIERQKIRSLYCTVHDNYDNDWNLREEAVSKFFNYKYNYKKFKNNLANTYQEFIGRAFSDSRAPLLGSLEYKQYTVALKSYFNKYATRNKLIVLNDTILYWGYL